MKKILILHKNVTRSKCLLIKQRKELNDNMIDNIIKTKTKGAFSTSSLALIQSINYNFGRIA